MDNESKPEFEGYAVVELFGRNQIAGYVTDVAMFGTSMMRVDVPDTDNQPGYTKFFGGSAIYAVTPVTKEAALYAAKRLDIRPVQVWVVPTPRPELPQGEMAFNSWDEDDDEWEDADLT